MTSETQVSADILEALRNRRSISRVRPEAPDRETIQKVITAGTWAPNHYLTEPWRFTVIEGEARHKLGDILEISLRRQQENPDSHESQVQQQRERRKPLRAPVIIAVAVEPTGGPKVIEIEEIAAGAAAVQNMLLAAEALGLAAMWRTGPAAYDPNVKSFLQLSRVAHILAFIYIGYPDVTFDAPRMRRRPVAPVWLD